MSESADADTVTAASMRPQRLVRASSESSLETSRPSRRQRLCIDLAANLSRHLPSTKLLS